MSGTGIEVVPKLAKCPVPVLKFVVVRGHPGYIPGFPLWIFILLRIFGILLLAAGNIVHRSQSVFGLVSSN